MSRRTLCRVRDGCLDDAVLFHKGCNEMLHPAIASLDGSTSDVSSLACSPDLVSDVWHPVELTQRLLSDPLGDALTGLIVQSSKVST